jgi:hypothetical protein
VGYHRRLYSGDEAMSMATVYAWGKRFKRLYRAVGRDIQTCTGNATCFLFAKDDKISIENV